MKNTHNQSLGWNWTGPKFKIQLTLTIWILISIIIGSIQMVSCILDGLWWIINNIT